MKEVNNPEGGAIVGRPAACLGFKSICVQLQRERRNRPIDQTQQLGCEVILVGKAAVAAQAVIAGHCKKLIGYLERRLKIISLAHVVPVSVENVDGCMSKLTQKTHPAFFEMHLKTVNFVRQAHRGSMKPMKSHVEDIEEVTAGKMRHKFNSQSLCLLCDGGLCVFPELGLLVDASVDLIAEPSFFKVLVAVHNAAFERGGEYGLVDQWIVCSQGGGLVAVLPPIGWYEQKSCLELKPIAGIEVN